MRKKQWVWISVLACVLIAGAFVLLAVFQKETPGTITARDIRGAKLYVNNYSCRIVEEEEYRDKVAALVTKVVPLRPFFAVYDARYGPPSDAPSVLFVTDKFRCKIYFDYWVEQMSHDYPHGDNLVVLVSKSWNGKDKEGWSWYCTLSYADYTALYDLAAQYHRGKRVDPSTLTPIYQN